MTKTITSFEESFGKNASAQYVYNLPILRGEKIIEKVFSVIDNNGFICGGFARYALSPNENTPAPSDIDIFCETEEIYNSAMRSLLNNKAVKKGRKTKIEAKFEISLHADNGGFHREFLRVQLIKPTIIHNMVSIGDAETILKNFDFTIAKCAILPDKTTIAHADFVEHDESMSLVIENIHCPISSMKRVIKYCKKGYSITSAELLKLFIDYENRSEDWKKIVHDGLYVSGKGASEEFIELMYFD